MHGDNLKLVGLFKLMLQYFDCDILYCKAKFKTFFLTKHSLPMTGTTSRCSPQQGRHKLMSTETSHLFLKRASSSDTKGNCIILHLSLIIHVRQPSEYRENFLPTNLMRMRSIDTCHFSPQC